MNIIITGRHINVSDKLKDYANKKIEKLEKYFYQLIDAHVIMHVEKLDHVSEVIINGDGIQFHGREKAADFFSSIDLLFEKMERQIVRYKEKHSSHKVVNPGKVLSFDYRSEEGKEIQLFQVSNKPIDKVEAYLQMKLENNDFILFKKGISEIKTNIDYSNKSYAVIFKDNDNLKMVEIPFKKIKKNGFEYDNFDIYNIEVKKESPTNPKLKFKRDKKSNIHKLTLNQALDEVEDTGREFLSFFNTESQYFNVIYKNGDQYEVMVPAF